jgi:hypothetical protein
MYHADIKTHANTAYSASRDGDTPQLVNKQYNQT